MKNKKKRQEVRTAILFLLPEMLVMVVFVLFPMIYALYLSFTEWNGFNPVKEFVGLRNYVNLFQNEEFWNSFSITFLYTILYVVLLFVVALLFALLNHSIRGKSNQLYRTLIFSPHSVSMVIAGIVWSFILNNQKGYLNQLLQLFGIPRQGFLASRSQALICIVFISLWIAVGYYMIIFVAALKDIPASYYEAAEIDGAGPLQKFAFITLPSLKDTSIFVFVVSTIAALQLFEPIQVVTKGGPAKATYTIVKYIYDTAFQLQDMGGASAAAFILFLVIMLLTIVQFKVTKMEL